MFTQDGSQADCKTKDSEVYDQAFHKIQEGGNSRAFCNDSENDRPDKNADQSQELEDSQYGCCPGENPGRTLGEQSIGSRFLLAKIHFCSSKSNEFLKDTEYQITLQDRKARPENLSAGEIAYTGPGQGNTINDHDGGGAKIEGSCSNDDQQDAPGGAQKTRRKDGDDSQHEQGHCPGSYFLQYRAGKYRWLDGFGRLDLCPFKFIRLVIHVCLQYDAMFKPEYGIYCTALTISYADLASVNHKTKVGQGTFPLESLWTA